LTIRNVPNLHYAFNSRSAGDGVPVGLLVPDGHLVFVEAIARDRYRVTSARAECVRPPVSVGGVVEPVRVPRRGIAFAVDGRAPRRAERAAQSLQRDQALFRQLEQAGVIRRLLQQVDCAAYGSEDANCKATLPSGVSLEIDRLGVAMDARGRDVPIIVELRGVTEWISGPQLRRQCPWWRAVGRPAMAPLRALVMKRTRDPAQVTLIVYGFDRQRWPVEQRAWHLEVVVAA